MSSKIWERISLYLPRLGLCSLILCLLSGIILAFQYRPFDNVFQNIEEITSIAPYGWFFRQFHYISGQVFAILMLFHTADHFLRKRYERYSASRWILLIFSLGLCFFTLFTGFILKGDKEGIFAGTIFMNILQNIPFAGRYLAGFFIDTGNNFFFLPFLYHCFFLPILILYLLRRHIREWLPDYKYFALAIIGLSLYSLFIDPFTDIPPGADTALVKGPWFFLGIQSLLKIMDPLVAGILIPAAFLGAVLILPVSRGLTRKAFHYAVTVGFCAYVILSVKSAIWGP
ncbi:cytochrome b N-terminal domain-containing protein [Thermodesulfobacteriota bacterium]